MIFESTRKMTAKEQMAFDLGYAKALGEIERLTAERDAALRDLKHMDNCDICAHGQEEVPGCDVECEGCKLDCACRDCLNEDKWQWRGPEPGGEGEG